MNQNHIQRLRQKLQSRVDRLKTGETHVFHYSLQQFWGFLQDQPILRAILEDLQRRCPSAKSDADCVVHFREEALYDDELKNAALACSMIESCASSGSRTIECDVVQVYRGGGSTGEKVRRFQSLFLDPLREYLDEHLDDERAILWLLRRYKHKCEWFRKLVLYDLWKADTQRGEARLKARLFEYLHDQGMDFFIEPKSASGEVDLISDQVGEDRLIAEVKVFNPPSAGRSHVVAGLNQTYTYTRDYNRPFGYLVVYNVSQTDLCFTVPHQEQSTPFVVHNGKTIFLLTIDICPHQPPASKRGRLKTVEISEADLVDVLTQPAPAETDDGSVA